MQFRPAGSDGGRGCEDRKGMPSKPKLGQNFLSDTSAAEQIVEALGDVRQETVLEIGPGRGVLTRLLARRAHRVLAVELDPGLAAELRSRFAAERVMVIEQDILRFDFAAASAQAGGRLTVIGNLPYYITSPILLKLAANHASLVSAVLMVQREVADRVAAAPGSRDYGLLSVTMQMHGAVEKLFTLSPEAFSPPPEVHSTVFRWRFAPPLAELCVEKDGALHVDEAFLGFLRIVFAQKRKTLANNLRAAGFGSQTVAAALTEAGVERQARAETVPVEALAVLWRSLSSSPDAPATETQR